MAKITVNVWDFGPLGTAITPLQRGGFHTAKINGSCENVFSKTFVLRLFSVVVTTVNDFEPF